MMETIHIYHTNDIHSHFEQWPRISAFLKRQKAYHTLKDEEVFLFDCGDFTDRYHPFTEGSMGKGNTELLNQAGYTAVTIGNNEGITLPYEGLNTLYESAKFDVIVANLYQRNGERPTWAKPYQLYKTKSGLTIGVTAVTTFYEHLYSLLGWKVTDPFMELALQLENLKQEADFIIVLSHLGIHDDEKVANMFPEIDLLLGAHTHHYFPCGELVNNTMIAATGKYGMYVGHVEIHIDINHPRKFHIEPKLYDSELLPPVKNEKSIVQKYWEIGKQQLNIPITFIDKDLSFSWKKPSFLAKLLCEAIHEWCKGDCTLIPSGLILRNLKRGTVTKYDVHQMLPHPINPCTVELEGEVLKEILLMSLDEGWANVEVKGLGFRGVVMGIFVYEGIIFDYERGEIFINGNPLEEENMYTLATVDMFTFGRFFPQIQEALKITYFMPELLRDIMEWKLKKEYGTSI